MKGNRFKHMLLIAFSGALAIVAWRAGSLLFSINSYQCVVDAQLSASTKKIVKAIVAQQYQQSFASLSNTLAKACPALKKICIERCADHQLKVTAQALAPRLRLADNAVLTENGAVVAAEHFCAHALKDVPRVAVRCGGQSIRTFLRCNSVAHEVG